MYFCQTNKKTPKCMVTVSIDANFDVVIIVAVAITVDIVVG